MKSPRSSSDTLLEGASQNAPTTSAATQHDGYRWTALSVTTVGALLAAMQGSALLIALPNIMKELQIGFFTIILV